MKELCNLKVVLNHFQISPTEHYKNPESEFQIQLLWVLILFQTKQGRQ